jgi:hypothetical protein
MNQFKKEYLLIEAKDSMTVQRLKNECNELINEFNQLHNPVSEKGQVLALKINSYVMKLHTLKDLHY